MSKIFSTFVKHFTIRTVRVHSCQQMRFFFCKWCPKMIRDLSCWMDWTSRLRISALADPAFTQSSCFCKSLISNLDISRFSSVFTSDSRKTPFAAWLFNARNPTTLSMRFFKLENSKIRKVSIALLQWRIFLNCSKPVAAIFLLKITDIRSIFFAPTVSWSSSLRGGVTDFLRTKLFRRFTALDTFLSSFRPDNAFKTEKAFRNRFFWYTLPSLVNPCLRKSRKAEERIHALSAARFLFFVTSLFNCISLNRDKLAFRSFAIRAPLTRSKKPNPLLSFTVRSSLAIRFTDKLFLKSENFFKIFFRTNLHILRTPSATSLVRACSRTALNASWRVLVRLKSARRNSRSTPSTWDLRDSIRRTKSNLHKS